MTAIDVVAVAGSLGVLALVVSLIVRRRLKPRYALLWLVAACALVGVSVWRDSIDIVGSALGIDYKPVVVFLAIDIGHSPCGDDGPGWSIALAQLGHHIAQVGRGLKKKAR